MLSFKGWFMYTKNRERSLNVLGECWSWQWYSKSYLWRISYIPIQLSFTKQIWQIWFLISIKEFIWNINLALETSRISILSWFFEDLNFTFDLTVFATVLTLPIAIKIKKYLSIPTFLWHSPGTQEIMQAKT